MKVKLYYASEENAYEIDVREFETLEDAKEQMESDIADDIKLWENNPQAHIDYVQSTDETAAEGYFGSDYFQVYMIGVKGTCLGIRNYINSLRKDFIAMCC